MKPLDKFQLLLKEAFGFCVEGGMAININPIFLQWFADDKEIDKMSLKRYLSYVVNEYSKKEK